MRLDEAAQSTENSFKDIDFTFKVLLRTSVVKKVPHNSCYKGSVSNLSTLKVLHIQLVKLIKVCSLNLVCTTPGLDTPVSIICLVCSGSRMDRYKEPRLQSCFYN